MDHIYIKQLIEMMVELRQTLPSQDERNVIDELADRLGIAAHLAEAWEIAEEIGA
jgi:NTP pyrophosphatase (non-canonical NTP hydrolase)